MAGGEQYGIGLDFLIATTTNLSELPHTVRGFFSLGSLISHMC